MYAVELVRALWSIIEGVLAGRMHASRCRDSISQVWTGVGRYGGSAQKARSRACGEGVNCASAVRRVQVQGTSAACSRDGLDGCWKEVSGGEEREPGRD